ncbi:GNAT family N-acetyltransferase [Nitrospira sp. T9]|uniref:GNAT family N-acetyltransferase n=1 Tax=unclassified Nitrospira TaxID=2652172 RepID=UPI003F9C0F0A
MDITFRFSNSDDIRDIHTWLVDQNHHQVHGTFLCNWNLTKKTYERGELIVAVYDDAPIAYIWKNFGIIEVKEEYRRKGVGRLLVEYALNLHQKSNSLSIGIECTPETSLPFWQQMGFKLYSDNCAYYLLENKNELPQDGVPINVEICFYPSERAWKTEIQPIEIFTPKALKCSDGLIHLEKRVSIYSCIPVWNGDPLIGIKVDGKEIHLAKAKYESSKEIGVLSDDEAFAIEKITT